MKNIFFVIAVLAFFAVNTNSFAATNSAILGTWKVEVPDAPWEYSKSKLVITETEKGLTAKLVFENNYEVEVNSIEFAKDILKFSFYIDGENILVTGKYADSKIAGAAVTPEGDMKFTAIKAK